MTTKNFISSKAKVVVLIISLLCLYSCIEDYPIVINQNYKNALVVDGKITNLPGPYTIKLSAATSIEDDSYNPVKNATVTISDNEGNTENLSEIEPGKYQTSADGIRGIVGRSYKIIIQTNAGKHYESEFEELLAPIGIESLTANLESPYTPKSQTTSLNIDQDEGYQFYVTTADSEKNQNYYWQLDETWEIRSYYKITRIYDPMGGPNQTGRYYLPESIDTLYYCWKSIENKIFTASTAYLNTSRIINHPLNFVSAQSEMLKYKYSLLLTQYTISEETHNFLNALINQEDGLEGLYTKQPYQIRGNVYNIDNSEEVVLGYFIVASTTERTRLTVARPPEIKSRWIMECEGDDFPVLEGESLRIRLNEGYELYYLTDVTFTAYGGFDGNIPYLTTVETLPPVECIDCTSRGATTIKPDYWDQ